MVVDARNHATLASVRTFASVMLYPLLVAVDLPQRFYHRSSDFFALQRHLMAENAELRLQVQTYAARQHELEAIKAENQRLRASLEGAARPDYELSLAYVLNVDGDALRGLVILDKGAQHGVFEGQPVVEGNRIYGQVVRVNPLSSTVMQLIDREHAIPVQNQRTGERGLARGHGRGMPLEIKNLPPSTTVQEGDLFVSSGLGGIFPVGFEVAKVGKHGVKFKPGDPFAMVLADPVVNFEAVRDVILLRQKPVEVDAAAAVVAPPVGDVGHAR